MLSCFEFVVKAKTCLGWIIFVGLSYIEALWVECFDFFLLTAFNISSFTCDNVNVSGRVSLGVNLLLFSALLSTFGDLLSTSYNKIWAYLFMATVLISSWRLLQIAFILYTYRILQN
jgi:hypothetical protein